MNSPILRVRALRKVADEMARLDQDLFDAERDGNTSARIVAHRERAQLWRKYAELLSSAGADAHAAQLAARSDDNSAYRLEQDPR